MDAPESSVTISLTTEYATLLASVAKSSKKTPGEVASEMLVAALEVPSWDELIRNLTATSNEVTLLQLEMEELKKHTEQLRVTHRVTTEILLIYIGGLTNNEARAVIDELFEKEGR